MLKQTHFIQRFKDFMKSTWSVKGKCYVDNGEIILELEGVSAHGMEPDNGKNAGLLFSTISSMKIIKIRLHSLF